MLTLIKYFVLSVLFLFLFVASSNAVARPTNDNLAEGDFVPGEILIKLRNNFDLSPLQTEQDRSRGSLSVSSSNIAKLPKSIRNFDKKYKIQSIGTLFNNEQRISGFSGTFKIKLENNSTAKLKQALKEFQKSNEVIYAEPNYIMKLDIIPNDPLFNKLWHFHNSSQLGGPGDADIDAPDAWDITSSAKDVVVAVIDSGIEYTHEDLAANIWKNTGEIANNSIDDDNNGYIDDYYGCNLIAPNFIDDNIVCADPRDTNFHGTHVAGIIAAAGDNGLGLTGVVWKAKLMAVKFIGSSGVGAIIDAQEAIYYAIQNGADIINVSWGSLYYSQSLYDMISYGEREGVIFVASAGNQNLNNDNNPHYPSNYDQSNIISVAATDHTDGLLTNSNYGEKAVDLAAPGESIYSTGLNNTYLYLSGTSMATPQVSGAAALLIQMNPSLNPSNLREELIKSVDKIPALSGKVVSGGRLNIHTAVKNVASQGFSQPLRLTETDGVVNSSGKCNYGLGWNFGTYANGNPMIRSQFTPPGAAPQEEIQLCSQSLCNNLGNPIKLTTPIGKVVHRFRVLNGQVEQTIEYSCLPF